MGLVIPGSGTTANLLVGDSIRTQRGRTIEPANNYIDNPNFTTALTTGWATYADAAGVTPVDGTGGSPNVTFTAFSGSLVRGVVSGRLTKDAANRQGQGAAFAFTLNAADTGLPVSVSLDFLASANFVASDVGVYIYDITNAVLITPASVNISAGKGTFRAFFVASTSTSYRLILHVASTNASAWTLDTDTFYAGPQVQLLGFAGTDPITYTPTTSLTNTTMTGTVARIGKYARLHVNYVFTGTPVGSMRLTTAQMLNGLGITADVGSVTETVATGTWKATDVGIANYAGQAQFRNDGNLILYNSGTEVTVSAPFVAGNTDNYTVDIDVPISNWSSNVTMAERAGEEYAWNTNLSINTNDSANFGYGATGARFAAHTVQVTKRVRFQTPIQPTDNVFVEVVNAVTNIWTPLAGTPFNSSNSTTGIGLGAVNSTDFDVYFGSAGYGATIIGGGGGAWSGVSGTDNYKWRVRKVSGGAAVGYPVGTPNIVGRTDGLAPAAGMLGQEQLGTINASSATTQGTLAVLSSYTINRGVYLVQGTCSLLINTVVGGFATGVAVTLNSASLPASSIQIPVGPSASAGVGLQHVAVLNVTSDASTIRLLGIVYGSSGAFTWTAAACELKMTRIA